MEVIKEKSIIIQRFLDNVRGEIFNPSGYNKNHSGAEGHWLEKQMGIKPNGDNKPDILGYEMKMQTSSGKTTFGDWPPHEAIWHKINPNPNLRRFDRDKEFLKIFGKENSSKKNRLSWSGEPAPRKISMFNEYGQTLIIDANKNILAIYNYEKDNRENKNQLVPLELQRKYLILAKWRAEKMQEKVENKFGISGWFKCFKDNNGIYDRIGFGPAFTFDLWINLVKNGTVYFDSGMYEGNPRPYSQWRANNLYWDKLIEEFYP